MDDTRRATESEMIGQRGGGPGVDESDLDDAESVRLDLAATLETEHEALVRAEVAKAMRVLSMAVGWCHFAGAFGNLVRALSLLRWLGARLFALHVFLRGR